MTTNPSPTPPAPPFPTLPTHHSLPLPPVTPLPLPPSTTTLPLINPHRLHYTPSNPSTRLGIGTFGSVYSGKYAGADVAIKCIKSENAGDLKRVWNSVRCFEGLKHPCVVQFFGVALGDDCGEGDGREPWSSSSYGGGSVVGGGDGGEVGSLLVVTELMHGGSLMRSLDEVRRGCGKLEVGSLLRIGGMVSGALRYLHGVGFTSGTVKSLNVLLSECVDGGSGKLSGRARAKLADFGLSSSMFGKGGSEDGEGKSGGEGDEEGKSGGDWGRECKELSGSAPYMSPEAWDGINMDKPEMRMAADVYALGVVLYELITLRRPWCNTAMPEIFDGVFNQGKRPEWPKNGDEDWREDDRFGGEYYEELKKLVEDCWKEDWEQRPSAARVYEVLNEMQRDFDKKKREKKKQAAVLAASTSGGSATFVDGDRAQKSSRKSLESTAEEVQLEDVMNDNEGSAVESGDDTVESGFPDPPALPSPIPLDSLNHGMRPLQPRLAPAADSAELEEVEVEVSSRPSTDSFGSGSSVDYYSAAVSLYKKPTNSTDNGTDAGSASLASQATFTSNSLSNKEIEQELSTWVNVDLKTFDKRSLMKGKKEKQKKKLKSTPSEQKKPKFASVNSDKKGNDEGNTTRYATNKKGPAKRQRRVSQSSVLDANQVLQKKSSRLDYALLEASSGAETWEDHVEAIDRAAEKKDHSMILGLLRMHGKEQHVACAGVTNLVKVLQTEKREFDFCEEGGTELLLAAVQRFGSRDAEIAKAFCDCITILAAPYDPRICHVMRAVGVSAELIACIDNQADDPQVLTSACTALNTLCGGTNLVRQAIASLGGSVRIHRVLSRNLTRWENVDLARASLKFCLQFAWQNSMHADELMNLSVVDSVNRIAQVFTTDSKLDEDVIAVLEALANFPKGKTVITESGGFNSIASILARVGKNYKLAERCCVLVVSIAEWRDPACGDAILRSSVVEGIVTVTRMAIQLTDESGGRLGFHAAQSLLYIICYGEAARTRVRNSSGLIVLINLLQARKDDAYCCGRTVAAIAALMLDANAQKELISNDGVKLLQEVQAQYPRHEISEVCKKALKRLKNVEDSGLGNKRAPTKKKFWWRLHRKEGKR